jgi:hypothetical protein
MDGSRETVCVNKKTDSKKSVSRETRDVAADWYSQKCMNSSKIPKRYF